MLPNPLLLVLEQTLTCDIAGKSLMPHLGYSKYSSDAKAFEKARLDSIKEFPLKGDI
jgi:hypothetical protein